MNFLGSVHFGFSKFCHGLVRFGLSKGQPWFGSVRFAVLNTVWTEKLVRFGRTAWPYL